MSKTKICASCKIEKIISEFSSRNKGKYVNSYCQRCDDKRKRAWEQDNLEQVKQYRRNYYSTHAKEMNKISSNYHLKKKYGLTLVEKEELMAQQNNLCAICFKTLGKRNAVDHNHETGKIRGILCINCNTGLGHLKDSVKNLQSAIQYLESA